MKIENDITGEDEKKLEAVLRDFFSDYLDGFKDVVIVSRKGVDTKMVCLNNEASKLAHEIQDFLLSLGGVKSASGFLKERVELRKTGRQ